MILLCEHPARHWMRERPINSFGLAFADQGHPRAALDANDCRIRSLGAQHPVQSYGQLTRRCHLGHSLGLLMTAMQILCETRDRNALPLSPLPPEAAHKAIALLADRAQPLTSAARVLAGNQSQIAGHLPAPCEEIGRASCRERV